MTTDEARLKYQVKGLQYSDIGRKEIILLTELVSKELTFMVSNVLELQIKPIRKKDIAFNLDGTLKHAFLRVKGAYFTDREAISFNNGGFIGFAGWADKRNAQPFITAFSKWIDQIKQNQP